LFLIVALQPWFSNVGKRLVKSPKLYLNDTGLLCHLIGCDGRALIQDGTLLGQVFENFVVMEIIKQMSWSEAQPRIFHFRTEAGQEVDIVLERADGKIVGIECKSSSSIDAHTFKGLRALKEITGNKFHRGIVLYTGNNNLTVGDGLEALPISELWETTAGAAPRLGIF
jgi:predicted AAA+ superfamily ATPase